MDQLPKLDTDLSEYSLQSLETIRGEIEYILESTFYQLFLATCESTKSSLMDGAMQATLRGVESLFTREQILGEAQCWKNVQSAIPELLEDITTEIKKRK